MAVHGADGITLAGHHADIDPALVIAVDHHHVPKRCAADRRQDLAVEGGKHRAALDFDDTEHVGLKIDHRPRGIAHGVFIDRLVTQFQRSYPVSPAIGNDHHTARRRPLEQTATVSAKDDERPRIGLLHTQLDDEPGNRDLVCITIFDLTKQLVQCRETLQNGLSLFPAAKVHRFGTIKEILNVVDSKTHLILPRLQG